MKPIKEVEDNKYNLSGLDLSNVHLSEANLRKANLDQAHSRVELGTTIRDIKFRIYYDKRMLYNPYIQGRDQIDDVFNGNNNKFIWMQYSGLKDKNGNEIYEGDIIQWAAGREVVVFEYGMFMAGQMDLRMYVVGGCEV